MAPRQLGWLCLLAVGVGAHVGCTSAPPKSNLSVSSAPEGMLLLPAGEFVMGSDAGNPDEKPAHKVRLSAFLLDKPEVTNEQFAAFVRATGYKTTAELPLDPKDFPDVPADKLKPGAAVFTTGKGWSYVPGANWRHPGGPATTIEGKENHPVVQVSWDDATAYAKWANKRLPTEAEWEYAAKAGRTNPETIWVNAGPTAKPQANIWQGSFPEKNDNTDGFLTTAPVGSFPPSPNGLYDMAGNVWEWCSDWYRPDAFKDSPVQDPKGPASSYDPDEPNLPKRVMRGGSFLCADCYCRGYRPTARMKSSPDTGLFHVGFRCAKSP